MQETTRKYIRPTNTKNHLKGRFKARWKDDVEDDIRKMGTVK
jgi:hypothetical protein